MNNKGFTLVELLATIVIMSLLIGIAVPSSISVSNRIKGKLLSDKLTLVEKSAILWAQDNKRCFSSTGCTDIVETHDNNCTINDQIKTCNITIDFLASDGYYNYDDNNKIANPKDSSKCLNNYIINISYHKKSRTFTATINPENQDSSCNE